MYFFISSLQRKNKRNYSSNLSKNIENENNINPEILFRQENLIRKSLVKLVKESKENRLSRDTKFIIESNYDIDSENNYSFENYENEISEDEISTEEMSLDEIIENLFLQENSNNNDKNYKRTLVISKLEEFKYKYSDKHMKRKEKECAICLEEFKEFDRVKLFSCKQHIFHKDCIMKWLLDKDFCPLCKKNIIY